MPHHARSFATRPEVAGCLEPQFIRRPNRKALSATGTPTLPMFLHSFTALKCALLKLEPSIGLYEKPTESASVRLRRWAHPTAKPSCLANRKEHRSLQTGMVT